MLLKHFLNGDIQRKENKSLMVSRKLMKNNQFLKILLVITFDKVVDIIDEYKYDYNNNRKQLNQNRMTLIEYRQILVA